MSQVDTLEGTAFDEHIIDADGFQVRYLEAGVGDPLVVLHGGGGVQISYAEQLLAADRRVIAIEVPGFGNSAVNERSNSMESLADTIVQVIDELKLESYGLIGTSFGGKLACWLAVKDSQRVSTLVLVAPATIRPDGWTPPDPGAGRELMFAHPDEHEVPVVDPEIAAKQQNLVQRLMGPNREPDLEARLAELEVQTMVVFGTQDGILSPSVGSEYVRLMPNAILAFIYDAGHAPQLERPEAFADMVGDFLTRTSEFPVTQIPSLINP